jgi:hypothetical protein
MVQPCDDHYVYNLKGMVFLKLRQSWIVPIGGFNHLPATIGLMYFFMEPNMRARGVIIFKFILFNNY